ncbi:outer membrane beta-barrel protein [Bdellovibrio sp. 22V]|uniref:outer membrane beta-barrel protein n=1 Tax=Bdellovibrio TaxID=958 RepID=UPI002543DB8E|nr:outer membrane beta-barrel protein [Bdellovibrio sp. 22V]WII71599.1 outer membrane beta-barrel protein [Bdellovibrio sp. 22V]
MKYMGLCLLLVLFLLSNQAHAVGFYIEPGITYERGDNELDWPAPLSSSTGNQTGFGLNLKLGIHVNDVFFMGLDGSYSKPDFDNSATNYDAEAVSTTYGAILGAQMPGIGLRIWGGYIFGGDLDPDKSGDVDLKFTGAHGPKVGLGFRIFFVSLNVEYMDLQYNESELQEAGPVTGTFDEDLKNKVGLISVSIPLTL